MPNLLEIGRSGLLFYRQALGTTSENIANVNTEGYHRRTAESREMLASVATPTTTSNGGQGVQFDQIRRAFDQLVQDRARTSSASLTRAESYAPHIKMLEERLTPGIGGLTEMLESFFEGLGALALAPNDTGLRRAAMETAEGFADTVSATALSMETLMDGIADEATQHINRANAILEEMSDLQNQLLSVKDTGIRNPILDERDRLIGELNDIMDISVEIGSKGTVKVTMGESPGGPILIDGIKNSRLSLTDNLRVEIDPYSIGKTVQTRTPQQGALGGLFTARNAVDMTLDDFDTWAQGLVNDFNAEHQNGLDAQNRPGGELFSLVGWKLNATPLNRGTASATMTVNAHPDMPEGPLKMVYDGAAGLWNTYDDVGTLLTQSSSGATLPGLSIEMDGMPETGDVMFLERTDGQAINLKFVPTETSQLAMAAALRVAPDPANTGTSTIAVRGSELGGVTVAPDLSVDFATGATALNAVEFLAPGTVGYIPAGATSANLMSLAGQAEVQFTLPAGSTYDHFDVEFQGQVYTFDLTQDADGQPIAPLPSTADDVVSLLNSGQVVAMDANGDPVTATDLGIFASGTGTDLRLASTQGDISHLSKLFTPANVAVFATKVSDYAPASDIILFTREGRQISGPVLSAEEAALLLTPANGFYDTAIYNTDTLNHVDGYRGIDLQRGSSLGDFRAALGAGGTPVTYTATSGVPAANPASVFELWVDGIPQGDLTLPQGASAERMASLIDDQFGVTARAENHVEITAPTDGQLRFLLTGDNLAPLELSAKVQNGSMADIAAAVNILSGQTGITADISSDGGRMVLTHASGETIHISGVQHSLGDSLSVQRVDRMGRAIDAQPSVIGGAAADDSVRMTGVVSLESETGFDFALDGTGVIANRTVQASGLVGQIAGAAGSTQTLNFSYSAFADQSLYDAATDTTAAAGVQYDLTLTDPSGNVHDFDYSTLGVGVNSDTDLAKGVLDRLRADTPTSTITTQPLGQIPADGQGFSVSLGDQTYDISMQNGQVVVDGPEADRINAYFTAGNEFVIETRQGTLDGGMLVLGDNPRDAAAFGLGVADAPVTVMQGNAVDTSGLAIGANPFDVTIDGQAYTINAQFNAGLVMIQPPAGFPGTFNYDNVTNSFQFELDARAGHVTFEASAVTQSIGFESYGLKGHVENGDLVLRSTTGDVVDLNIAANSGAGTRVSIGNLPDEDILVVMRSPGALRLAGDIDLADADDITIDRPIRIEITDAASGEVEVFDAETGHSIATRWIDSKGTLQVAGYDVTLTRGYRDGDAFVIEPNLDGIGDGRVAENILDLRSLDDDTGRGGFGAMFMTKLNEVGGKVKAAQDRIDTAQAVNDTAQRLLSEASGVDLDTEAANLIQQQQAYQANAQIIQVARQLFDTLLNVV